VKTGWQPCFNGHLFSSSASESVICLTYRLFSAIRLSLSRDKDKSRRSACQCSSR